jgi:protein SCO1/2
MSHTKQQTAMKSSCFAAILLVAMPASFDNPSARPAIGDRVGSYQAGHDERRHFRPSASRGEEDYVRTIASYEIPDVTVLDANGERLNLRSVLDSDKPVLLNFIFTSCMAICPVLTATFAQTQERLGSEADKVRMISISIDPEQDTPVILKKYAEKFHAGPHWRFLTGNLPDIVAVQKAFAAYRGNKMNHAALTLLRNGQDQPWVRLEGFASAAQLLDEYHRLMQ